MDRGRHRAARVRLTLFLAVMAWLAALPSAHAYVDPGSVSVVFQALIAGIAAAGTAVAMFWSRIVGFFRRSPKPDPAETDRAPEQV